MYMCPCCGRRFCDTALALIPPHNWKGKQCPGSYQNPRNALTDKRPLWKDEITDETSN